MVQETVSTHILSNACMLGATKSQLVLVFIGRVIGKVISSKLLITPSFLPQMAYARKSAFEICVGNCLSCALRQNLWMVTSQDVCHCAHQSIERREWWDWIACGVALRARRYVHWGTECTTWNIAPRGAYRSRWHLGGKPHLPRHRRTRVRCVNVQANACVHGMVEFQQPNIATILENLSMSHLLTIWHPTKSGHTNFVVVQVCAHTRNQPLLSPIRAGCNTFCRPCICERRRCGICKGRFVFRMVLGQLQPNLQTLIIGDYC